MNKIRLFRQWKRNRERQRLIKGSIEPTHGSTCSDVRKLQSMDVLKLQSNKADWNTKCPFHILALYTVMYWILSYREKLDVDSQRTKNAPFIWISGVKE